MNFIEQITGRKMVVKKILNGMATHQSEEMMHETGLCIWCKEKRIKWICTEDCGFLCLGLCYMLFHKARNEMWLDVQQDLCDYEMPKVSYELYLNAKTD